MNYSNSANDLEVYKRGESTPQGANDALPAEFAPGGWTPQLLDLSLLQIIS